MTLTLGNITPVGLCIATQDLFDTKRFKQNFCDNLILRARDKNLEPKLFMLKRDLNSTLTEKKFLEGYKVVIISNIDKILTLVSSRYSQIDFRLVQTIVQDGKQVIDKVLQTESFEKIAQFEPVFKSKITLPTYELFITLQKRSK
ncbi:MAG: hypothetical protein QXO27_03225 [Candidatus Aenigmatarchaeota archaeon]